MNSFIRRLHRWVSIIFTLGVIANVAVMSQIEPPIWVGLLALIPLIVLLFTGLYLFALPYILARRARRRA